MTTAEAPASFARQLPTIFTYPWRGNGAFILLGGMVFLGILHFLPFLGLVAALIGFLAGFYLIAYYLSVLSSSAQGSEEPPPWPDVANFQDDFVDPFIQVLITVWVCLGPSIVYRWFMNSGSVDVWYWVLLGGGIIYLPMALTAVVLFDSLAALNPLLVIPSIVRIFLPYLTAMVLLAGIFAAQECFSHYMHPQRFLGRGLAGFLGGALELYFVMVEMRLLGLLYRCHAARLGWFGR